MNTPLSYLIHGIRRHATACALVACLSLLTACTVEVPSHIIQQQEMEDLLYDYHLMQAISGDIGAGSQLKRKQYEQYVLDKHHVTEAQFDSSLAWYMRHTKELEEIYKKLDKRYTDKKQELAEAILPANRIDQGTPAGDSVNIWNDYRLYRLTDSPLSNKLTFSIPADSNFHIHDTFQWGLQATYTGDTLHRAIMSLTLLLDHDTIGVTREIPSSDAYTLTLQCDSDYKIREISGFVYYYPTDTLSEAKADTLPSITPLLLISDISLMRYHSTDSLLTAKGDEEAVADSIKTEKQPEKEIKTDKKKELIPVVEEKEPTSAPSTRRKMKKLQKEIVTAPNKKIEEFRQ